VKVPCPLELLSQYENMAVVELPCPLELETTEVAVAKLPCPLETTKVAIAELLAQYEEMTVAECDRTTSEMRGPSSKIRIR
jgi:hypothetical protein